MDFHNRLDRILSKFFQQPIPNLSCYETDAGLAELPTVVVNIQPEHSQKHVGIVRDIPPLKERYASCPFPVFPPCRPVQQYSLDDRFHIFRQPFAQPAFVLNNIGAIHKHRRRCGGSFNKAGFSISYLQGVLGMESSAAPMSSKILSCIAQHPCIGPTGPTPFGCCGEREPVQPIRPPVGRLPVLFDQQFTTDGGGIRHKVVVFS